MPRPQLRSRSLRKVYVKLPSGKTVVHYKYKKPKIAHCSSCGKSLKGVKRERPVKIKRICKTKKRPQRPYPNLCSSCMRKKIISEVRKNV